MGFAEARPIDVETSSLVIIGASLSEPHMNGTAMREFYIIGASRSEPHTGDTNRDFPFICMCIYIYLPYVLPYRIYVSSISTMYIQFFSINAHA